MKKSDRFDGFTVNVFLDEDVSYAIEVVGDGLLQLDQSSIIAATGGGSAYAVKGNAGSYAKVTHCRIYALTEWFYNDGSYDVYSNVDGSSELEWWCVIDPTYRYSVASGFGSVSGSDYNYTKVIKKPSTPTSALIGSTTYPYPGTVCRLNDYIYINLGPVIREYNITNGNTVDITMTTATNYVVVEERKLVAVGTGSGGKYAIMYLEFDNNTTSVLHEWDEDEGVYISDTLIAARPGCGPGARCSCTPRARGKQARPSTRMWVRCCPPTTTPRCRRRGAPRASRCQSSTWRRGSPRTGF